MNEDKSKGHDVDGHVFPNIYHVNGLQGKCLGADDRLHRGPSDVFVGSVSKGATTKSSTEFANLSDSSSEEMKQKEEITKLSAQQDSPVKVEGPTTPDRSAQVQSAHWSKPDQEGHRPNKLQALNELLQQFQLSEKLRTEQENTARRLEERIRSAEIAHGMQLKQLAALQRAIEVRRNDIGADKKAYTETRLAQQQANKSSEELRATLNRFTLELQTGVHASTSASST